ncbi:MAG: tyrosine-type recombinase/integrase [Coriobacteriia bacterium]
MEGPTVGQAWDTWFAYRCCGARPLHASTRADYECIWRCHLAAHLTDVPLATLNGATIAQLVVELSGAGMGASRLVKVMIPLRACLRWHHRMGSLERDPSRWFDLGAVSTGERRILSIEEIGRLLDAMPLFWRPMITFLVFTGVRLGEMRALTWDDINLEARTASVTKTMYMNTVQHSTKTGFDRVVPIPSHVVEVLREWRERCPASAEGWAFPKTTGRALDGNSFRKDTWRPAVKRAGLPPGLRIHDLRHTSSSLYLQHGATVREVMEIHGWRQMETALRYLHTTESLNVAADRLSEVWEGRGMQSGKD